MWCDAISGKSDYKAVDIHWSRVPGRDAAWREATIRNTSERQFNQEFGCEFLGSVNTLIDASKLQVMGYQEYVEELYGMQIFNHPIKETYCDETKKQLTKDHMYVICSDISEGKNLDYTTFSIFDCSVLPYKQVARYRNNMIAPMLFPDVLKLCAEYYNKAYVLIEINNNPQVADCLYLDLEYENVFQISSGNKQSQTLTYNGRNPQNGLNMSPLVKRTGCTTLKTLIETNKLLINDFETISELTTFTVNRGSFSAEEGSHDDMVMTLVIFAWLTTQKLFIELSSTDIRKQLQIDNNYIKEDTEEAPPTIQFQTGLEKHYILDGGDLWEVVEQKEEAWY
jgi:organic radical activating enzyme